MKRRDFLTRGLPAMTVVAAVAGCAKRETGATAEARPRITWRMASSYPRGLDVLYGSAENFARRVGELTGGAFTIRVYPAGELVPANQVLDAVQQGTVQCGQTASYYYTGKNEALVFDTGLPFGLNTRQQMAWLGPAGGLALINEVLADFNIIAFTSGTTGSQMGGWFRREINSVADLNGLKMRIPGIGGEVMSRMKVTVQMLSGSEVYMALERGVIDAVEWVGPYDDEKLGFHNIVKNYYYPGWWEPGATTSNYVNRDAWARLPADYQAAVACACREACINMLNEYDMKNAEALVRLKAHGVVLRRFPEELLVEAEKITNEILAGKAAANPSFRKILDHWQAFRDTSSRWFATTEFSQQQYSLGRVTF